MTSGLAEQLALLPGYATAHLQLSLLALLAGAGLSVPAGIWVSRRERAARPVLAVASVVQTIPSLALLAIMVPTFAAIGALTRAWLGLGVAGIGFGPALVALSLYSVLPILRNTVTGILGVDPALVEAARGIGMTERQQLLRVELPLAMPVIVAGLRTSAVWVVGTATLSTPVGATSLGNYIFSGLQTRNYTAVLVGCVAAAALALVLDALIGRIESGLRERRRRRAGIAAAALLALFAYAGATLALDRLGSSAPVLRIGAKSFTEQYVLAEILARKLARDADLPSRAVTSLGSTVAFDALRQGDIDVYVDYSGTIWATLMKRAALPEDRSAVLREVRSFLRDAHGVAVVAALGFENTYALGMTSARARDLGARRISDLTPLAPRLALGADYEFLQREEWAAIRGRYGLAFGELVSMDPALMYQAVASGEVDVISAFSTDGRIAAYDLRLLEDDRGVIPPYDAILLVRPGLAETHPRAVAVLAQLDGAIDAAAMRRMNLAVDRDGASPASVADAFLDALPAATPAP